MYVSYNWQSWWSVPEILTEPSTSSGCTTNQKCCAGCQSWKPGVQVGCPEKLVHRVNREELRIDARTYRGLLVRTSVPQALFVVWFEGLVASVLPAGWQAVWELKLNFFWFGVYVAVHTVAVGPCKCRGVAVVVSLVEKESCHGYSLVRAVMENYFYDTLQLIASERHRRNQIVLAVNKNIAFLRTWFLLHC